MSSREVHVLGVLTLAAAIVGCGDNNRLPTTSPAPSPPIPSSMTRGAPTTPSPNAAPSASGSGPAPATTGAKADPVWVALRDAGLPSRRSADLVRSLTDEVGPRLTASPADGRAVAWAVQALKDAGYQNVRAEPVVVPHWERGTETAALVRPTSHTLLVTALGGSIGTDPRGVEGDVVEVESLEALTVLAARDPKALTGKVVFLNVATERTRDGSGYGRAGRVRWMAATEGAKVKAAAVVIRSVGTDGHRMPHTGATRHEKGVATVPAAALAGPDADVLHRTLKEHGSARLKLTLGCRWLPEGTSANVVGELPAGVPPTGAAPEIVLLGAHLDSWDLGRGALDDGAGVGIVVEAGRLLREHGTANGTAPYPRTLRVVLFANEENGLAGAKAYAKAHAAELPIHVAAMEADSGTARVYATRYAGAPEHRDAFLGIVQPLADLGVAVETRRAEGGADLSPLRGAGVPLVDLAQDFSSYFDIHHTADDTFDKVDPEALAQAATVFALTAHGILRMPERFGPIPVADRERKD